MNVEFVMILIFLILSVGCAVLYMVVYKISTPAIDKPLGAFLLLILITLGLFEIGIRFLPAPERYENPWFLESGELENTEFTDLPYRRKPNIDWYGTVHGDLALINGDFDPYARQMSFQTDSMGYRNREVKTEADIVFCGDSYTEAGNIYYDSTYSNLVTEKLKKSGVNLAVSGYSTPEELITFGRVGLNLKPKTLVFQIAESNDIIECVRFGKWANDGMPTQDFKQVEIEPIPVWKHFSILRRIQEFLFGPELNSFNLEGVFHSTGKDYRVRFLQLPSEKISTEDLKGWDIMRGNLDILKTLCDSNQIELVLIMIPDKINVLGPLTEFDSETTNSVNVALAKYSSISLGAGLTDFCSEKGIRFIDMTIPLRKAAKKGKLVYLPMDTHLSEAGHKVVAAELIEHLAD